MHSFLITGSPLQSLFNFSLQYLAEGLSLPADKLISHPDVFLVSTETSIPIKTVRDLKLWLKLKPFALSQKGVLIHPASLLTLPAQNALLKTLEEPPGNTIIILTTTNPHLLLPTIVSRCQVTVLQHTLGSRTSGVALADSPEVKIKAITQLLNQLPHLSPSQRLSRVGEYAISRNTAINFCESLLSVCRHNLRRQNDLSPHALRAISLALTRLKANVNPRLTLEQLFLHL